MKTKTYYQALSSNYKLPANDFFESEKELKEHYSWVEDLEIKEFTESDYWLLQVPLEFRSTLSYMAYESGHSAGEDEILSILKNLIADLKPAIEKFEARLKIG